MRSSSDSSLGLGMALLLGDALGDVLDADDVPGEADLFHEPDGPVGHVDFPPAVTLTGDALIGVVVVVPAFVEGEDADPPEVAAVVSGFVVAVTPKVGGRVDEPGDVQHVDHANAETPEDHRPAGPV